MVAFTNAFLEEIIEGNFIVNFVRIYITDRSKNICRIAVALRPFRECRSLIVVSQEILLDHLTSPLVIAVVRLRTIMRFAKHKNLVMSARIILTHIWVKVNVLRRRKKRIKINFHKKLYPISIIFNCNFSI